MGACLRRGQRLLLAALLLRALIPVGYMLNYSSLITGESLIVLCPTGLEGLVEGTAFESVLSDHGHHGANDGEGVVHRDAAPCVFAALAALLLILSVLCFILGLWPALRAWVAPQSVLGRRALSIPGIPPGPRPLLHEPLVLGGVCAPVAADALMQKRIIQQPFGLSGSVRDNDDGPVLF